MLKSLIFQHLFLKLLHLHLRGKKRDWEEAPSALLSELGFTHLPDEFSLTLVLPQIFRDTRTHTCKHRRCTDHCLSRFINTVTEETSHTMIITSRLTVRNGVLLKPVWTLHVPIATQFLFIQKLERFRKRKQFA